MTLHSLPDEFRNRLVTEFRLAVVKMAQSQSPRQFLYYYSVFFGELVRVLNWHWDETLVLIWSNVQYTHNAITNRVNAASQGDTVVALSDEFFKAVTLTSAALIDYIEKQGDEVELCHILGRFAQLTYATTGNGHYLLEKGIIKLED